MKEASTLSKWTKEKKMGRDGETNHVESQLSIPIEKRGQCSLVLRNGAMGARVLVFEILNGPNDLIMDIRQQFHSRRYIFKAL